MTLETGVKALAEAVAADVKALEDGKVDKVTGYSLVDDDEIAKLLTVEQDATSNRADSENADKVHDHTVEQVLGLGTAATRDVGTTAGQINPVGDAALYCLDIDDETQRGRWYVNDTTAGVKPSVYGVVNTYGVTGDTVNQEYVELVGGVSTAVMRRFCRNKYRANAWSPWTEYITSSSLQTTTGQSTEYPMTQKATTDAIANIPSVPKSAAYTVTAADKGASIDTSAGVTIPASLFAVGDVIVVTNTSASSISITPDSGVTFRLAGSASTGLRSLAGYGVATFRMVSSNVWFGSGAGLS